MPKSDLRIDILGTEFTIATDEEPKYLKKLLEKYRQTIENVQRKSGLKDPLKIAVLTGFLLCDDLEKAGSGDAKNRMTGEVEALTLGMISRLDEALKVSETADADDTVPEETTSGENLEAEKVNVTICKLENTVKNYDWGSPEWLPAFLGQKNTSRIPWAELWLGVNPAGPSRVIPGSRPLSELIAENPEDFLGNEIAGKYGNFPFLLKIIAAAKPLSIQVHPNASQAREGFERENKKKIPLDAANRNYKDTNEKNEILCAMTPFAALCGFRKAEEILLLMQILLLNAGTGESGLKEAVEDLVLALKQDDKNSIGNFLSALFALEKEKLLTLGSFIKLAQTQLQNDFPEYADEWHLCSYLSTLHPGDPGVIGPLFLNIVELAPNEAIFIPAGTPHSYINGMGIELLSNSDNVLRGGLTSKHVDHSELFKILDFSEFMPEKMRPPEAPHSLYSYPTGDFALTVLNNSGAGLHDLPYKDPGPSILIVTEGSASVVEGADTEMSLKKGESAFIPAGKKVVFSGVFTAYAASCRF